MADETFSVEEGGTKITFRLYWSDRWYDMIIQDDYVGETRARLMFLPHPEVLRQIAEQFYAWAETIESEVGDLRDKKELEQVKSLSPEQQKQYWEWDGQKPPTEDDWNSLIPD